MKEMIHIREDKLKAAIQICLGGDDIYTEELEAKLVHDIKALSIADIKGMLPDQMKRHIDLAYLTGVFNVSGIDGLQKELTRLKEIGKDPHEFCASENQQEHAKISW